MTDHSVSGFSGPAAALHALLCRFFEGIRVHTKLVSSPIQNATLPDYGIRSMITLEPDPALPQLPPSSPDKIRIALIEDPFLCHYILLSYPETAAQLLIGPYLHAVPGKKELLHLFGAIRIPASKFDALAACYDDIPLISDLAMLESFLTASIQTVFPGAGVIWSKETVAADAADAVLPAHENEDSTPSRLCAVEARYQIEEDMLDAIRRGSLEAAEQKLTALERQGLNNRSGSTLRDGKNYLIIMNTLCRVAARQAGIHPYDIDQLSRKFSIRIENYANYQDLFHSQLQHAMIRQYCMLVQNHSTSGYSPTMRRILHYIWIHEDEPLTLTELAAAMHLNRNYLCSLFRREMGETLTDYINRRKIQTAVRLMNTGRTDIAAIAEACGIENANYFSRLFKDTEGITATDYLRMLHRPSASSRSFESD